MKAEDRYVLIFCDLDGPILDVAVRYHTVHRDLMQELGATPLSQEEYWRFKRERCPERDILACAGAADAYAQYAARRAEIIESSAYLAYDRPQPGALNTLRELQTAHTLYLVSLRRHRERMLMQLDSFGMHSLFREVLVAPGGTGHDAQVKADLLRPHIGTGGKTAAVVIGDTEVDIEAGRALGVSTIAVCGGIRTAEFLASCAPDATVPAFSATPGALGRLT